MTETIYIDGYPGYATFGVTMTDSLAGIMSAPAFKPLETVDWPDEDGLEVDLSAPVLDSREIVLPLYITGTDADKYAALMTVLRASVYHTFRFATIDTTITARVADITSWEDAGSLGEITLRLAVDTPVSPASLITPSGALNLPSQGCSIDGIDISRYDTILLEGTRESVAAPASPKPALAVSTRNVPGITYDSDAPVRLSAKTVTLHCLMRALSVSSWKADYAALLNNLALPGPRRLVYGSLLTADCHYAGLQSVDLLVSRVSQSVSEVWHEIRINLTCIKYY